jgi:hypothetical protein
MRSVPAANAVLAALGRPAVGGLDAPSLKAAGFDSAVCRSAGFDWSTIREAGFSAAEAKAAGCDPASALAAGYFDAPALLLLYGYDAVAASGCDVSCVLVSFLLCSCTCTLISPLPPPSLQRDGPNLYMTLHCHKVDDRTLVEDGNKPVHVPAGWQIAAGDADDIRVCGAHPWQSRWLVFANGDVYGSHICNNSSLIGTTRSPSKKISSRLKIGQKRASGCLIQDAQGARAKGDACDVLLCMQRHTLNALSE